MRLARPRSAPALGATLLALACSCAGGSAAEELRAPRAESALLFTVDTLRADRLGPWGGTVATPNVDALARESLVFLKAYTPATITYPSLTSVLTGLFPLRHGVNTQDGRLREGLLTLPEILRAHGVATGSFVANLCKLQPHPGTVFHDGWDERFCGMHDEEPDDRDQYLWDEEVVGAALDWMARQHGPFFCWIHLMDPHAEHRPSPEDWDYAAEPVLGEDEQERYFYAFEEARTLPGAADMQHLLALYAAEVRGADRQLGRVLAFLAGRADRDRIAVVFGADHGEELYETWSRYDHGLSLTEGVLHVPLMLRAPGLAPGRSEALVESTAITPTLLDLFGTQAPYALDAKSLLGSSPGSSAARSSCGDVAITFRVPEGRYWFRTTREPFVRPPDEAPWRADAPWFRERESFARYAPEAPTTPIWAPPGDPAFADVAPALQTQALALKKSGRELPKAVRIEDPELARELESLGYVGGEDVGSADEDEGASPRAPVLPDDE
jgi:hypothetical protein